MTEFKGRSRAPSDPLARALQPPPDETADQRAERLRVEERARQRNETIDKQLRAEKHTKSSKKEIHLLLLGQSESGKSTTLKVFQLTLAPAQFDEECMSWRPVIYLNLIRSLRRVLECLTAYQSSPARKPSSSTDFTSYWTILSPVLELEEVLMKALSSRVDDVAGLGPKDRAYRELSVRPDSSWKKIWKKPLDEDDCPIEIVDSTDPVYVLNDCKDDMIRLWNNPAVQSILRQQNVRLEDSPGFFLDDIERLSRFGYCPTGRDVLKARLKTNGVSEHRFTVERRGTWSEKVEYRIYDVGGAMSHRKAWAQFFDSVTALIFLAPINVFDEVLAEDPTVNRIEDSFLLWKSICSNQLLASVGFILFLNKIDLLKAKLEAGVRVSDHIKNYTHANDLESVSEYFEKGFLSIHKKFSRSNERKVHVHRTSVIDTKATTYIVASIQDILLRAAFHSAALL